MKSTDHKKPRHAGKTSFNMIDSVKLFEILRLNNEATFLDIACGNGNYAMAAAEIIGPKGMIYAIDLWKEGIETLRNKASTSGLTNIKATVGDVSKRLPLKKNRVDVCLMAAVLHELVEAQSAAHTLKEITRVIRPTGILAIIEFKKIQGIPGPRFHVRLSPEEVKKIVAPFGFRESHFTEIGPYHFLLIFNTFEI